MFVEVIGGMEGQVCHFVGLTAHVCIASVLTGSVSHVPDALAEWQVESLSGYTQIEDNASLGLALTHYKRRQAAHCFYQITVPLDLCLAQ